MSSVPDLGLLEKPETLAGYLRESGLLDPGEVLTIEPLGGGISNRIVKVITPRRTLVLKQAQPKLRVAVDWFAAIDRVLIEADCMQALRPALPFGTVPEVYFIDRDNYLYAMECAPPDSVLWKSELLEGTVDLHVATHVGRILGLMHDKIGR